MNAQLNLTRTLSKIGRFENNKFDNGKRNVNVKILTSDKFKSNYNPKMNTLFVNPNDVNNQDKLNSLLNISKWNYVERKPIEKMEPLELYNYSYNYVKKIHKVFNDYPSFKEDWENYQLPIEEKEDLDLIEDPNLVCFTKGQESVNTIKSENDYLPIYNGAKKFIEENWKPFDEFIELPDYDRKIYVDNVETKIRYAEGLTEALGFKIFEKKLSEIDFYDVKVDE